MSPHCDLDFETAKQFFHRTLRLMVMCHHTNSGYKMPKGSEDGPDKQPLTFLTFVVTLTLNIVIHSFYKTLRKLNLFAKESAIQVI